MRLALPRSRRAVAGISFLLLAPVVMCCAPMTGRQVQCLPYHVDAMQARQLPEFFQDLSIACQRAREDLEYSKSPAVRDAASALLERLKAYRELSVRYASTETSHYLIADEAGAIDAIRFWIYTHERVDLGLHGTPKDRQDRAEGAS